jgi:hypothetical protein
MTKKYGWSIDALYYGHGKVVLDELSVFPTEAKAFLNDKKGSYNFVVGPKGAGKTFLLLAKRLQYENKNITCLPPDRLCYTFTGHPIFSKWMEYHLNKPENWATLFSIAIIISILKKLHIEMPAIECPYLKKLNSKHKHYDVGNYLSQLVHIISIDKKTVFQLKNDLTKNLMPLFCGVHAPVAIFIDGVDRYISYSQDIEHDVGLALWEASQLGFAEAVHDLTKSNSHFKIFSTLRQELFNRKRQLNPSHHLPEIQVSGAEALRQ